MDHNHYSNILSGGRYGWHCPKCDVWQMCMHYKLGRFLVHSISHTIPFSTTMPASFSDASSSKAFTEVDDQYESDYYAEEMYKQLGDDDGEGQGYVVSSTPVLRPRHATNNSVPGRPAATLAKPPQSSTNPRISKQIFVDSSTLVIA